MSQYKKIVVPKGAKFSNAMIKGFGMASFKATPVNEFDNGHRVAKKGEYKILSVVSKSKDPAPFAKTMDINGFAVKIGAIVNIQLVKDVITSVPKEVIIMTGSALEKVVGEMEGRGFVPPKGAQPNPHIVPQKASGSGSGMLDLPPIAKALIIIGASFGIYKLLKWKKVI